MFDTSDLRTEVIDGVTVSTLSVKELYDIGALTDSKQLVGMTLAIMDEDGDLRPIAPRNSADEANYTSDGYVVVSGNGARCGDVGYWPSRPYSWALIASDGGVEPSIDFRDGGCSNSYHEWRIVIDTKSKHPGWVPLSKLGDNPKGVLVNENDVHKPFVVLLDSEDGDSCEVELSYDGDAPSRPYLTTADWINSFIDRDATNALHAALGEYGKPLRDSIFIKQEHYDRIAVKPVELKVGQVVILDGKEYTVQGVHEGETILAVK